MKPEEEVVDIIKPLEPQKAKEGEDVVFECVLSKPDVPATWLKDGQEITPSEKVEMIVEGEKHKLILHDVKPEDAEKFTIKVGQVQSTANLIVEGMLNQQNISANVMIMAKFVLLQKTCVHEIKVLCLPCRNSSRVY